MSLAIALLSQRSLAFELYAQALDGASVEELVQKYHRPAFWIEERIQAVRLALGSQVEVSVNRDSKFFQ